MILRRFLIPVFSIAVLTGLFLLGHLFMTFQSEGLSPNRALLSAIGSAPLSWGYALTSAVVFIAFLVWVPYQLPVWRLLRRFRRVDSAVLDNDGELCQRFYHSLLEFRCRYGEARFMQRVAGHFNFFYQYHTDALHWMNTIIRQVDADSIPTNMITDSISSGHIGRVFTGCRYGGGLPSAFVKLDEAVYLLARMDRLEIWSASSHAPVCRFSRHALQLETEQRHQHNTSVMLRGMELSSQRIRQLELRIPDSSAIGLRNNQTSGKTQIDALQSWLNELETEPVYTAQENFGINVTEIQSMEAPTAPQPARTPLLDLLHNMLGSHIDALFSHMTLTIADPDIAQHSIVLCSGLGIIMIIDVPLAGTIHYNGEPHWLHIDSGSTQGLDNACLTAQRSKNALINRLVSADLNRWPVHGLVVFSHSEVQPELEFGQQQVQCDVITLGQMPKWFASQSSDDRIRFTKDDYNELITLLDPARLQTAKLRQA